MNYGDRRKIDQCINEINSIIDMRILWPRLLENRVFYNEDINVAVWKDKWHRSEVAREILETVKTRGPYAFRNLVLSLRETRHYQAADILEGKIPVVSNENQANNISEGATDSTASNEDDCYFSTKFLTTSEPLVIDVKHATKFMDELDGSTMQKYYMRKRPHGYVLIITIKAYIAEPVRNAAEHDQENLKKLFTDMGFEVIVPDPGTDLTGAEINRIVKEFSKRDFAKVDSCFVIISAHGNETQHNGLREDEILGIDYNTDIGAEKVLCSELINMFTSENCKELIEKPKVFIFQACRGKGEQISSRSAADGNTRVTQRKYADILIANSTIPGYKAYRDEFNGSWYIQILCEVFMRHACNLHIVDLFNKVDERLKTIRMLDGKAQTSTVKMIGFHKHLYLNPGIFEES